MEITGDIYAESKEDFVKACNEAKAQGYVQVNYKGCSTERSVYLKLNDERYQRKAKCGHCGHNNRVEGCKGHGSTCANCGEIMHYELLPGDLVRFAFREDEYSRTITLRVHEYNYHSSLIRFEKAIPKHQKAFLGARSRKDVLAILEEFKHCYNIVKDEKGREYYSFYYPRMLNDHAKINTYETRGKDGYGSGRTHCKVIQIVDGVEYDEHASHRSVFGDKTPVPITFHIYKDYKIQKNLSEICSRCGVNFRGSYYSGRGVNRGDLDSKHLIKIHGMIKQFHGEKAASEFVKVIEGAEDMSATAVIRRMEAYERNDYKWNSEWDKDQPENAGIELDTDSPAQMMATMAGVMYGNPGRGRSFMGIDGFMQFGEGDMIKQEFLNAVK